MKTYGQFKTDLLEASLPSHVTIFPDDEARGSSRPHNGVGFLRQSTAKSKVGQVIFKADSFDKKEFGTGASDHTIFRLETPLTNFSTLENASITKIDAKKGKISFVDDEKYIEEGIIKWSRPLKLTDLIIWEPKEFGL